MVKKEPDITPRMADVLRALARKGVAMTGNEIGYGCGFSTGQCTGHMRSGSMGPAQRVIGALNALRRRGYIDFAERRDGRTGTAYALTNAGRAFCKTWSLQ